MTDLLRKFLVLWLAALTVGRVAAQQPPSPATPPASSSPDQKQPSPPKNAGEATERFLKNIPSPPVAKRGPDDLLDLKNFPAAQQGLVVTSANLLDPARAQSGFDLPIETVQPVEVVPYPYSVQYQGWTLVIPVARFQPKRDKFSFGLGSIWPRLRRRSDGLLDIHGIESFAPHTGFSTPFLNNRATFWQSVEYRFMRIRVPGLVHLEKDLRDETGLESFDSTTGVSFDFDPTHRVNVILSIFPMKLGFVNLNTFNPQEVTPEYHQRGWQLGTTDRKTFANHAALDSLFTFFKLDANIYPAVASSDRLIYTPEQNYGSFFNHQDRESWRVNWQEIYRLPPLEVGGQHSPLAGLNVSYSTFTGRQTNSPVEMRRSDYTLAELVEFAGPTRLGQSSTFYAAFVQDEWRPRARISVNYGLRFERDTQAPDNNFGPRFGVALALTRDFRTLLRVGGGLLFGRVPLSASAFPEYPVREVTRYALDGITPLGPTLQYPNVILAGGLHNARLYTWNAALERELGHNLFLRAAYRQQHSRGTPLFDPLLTPEPRVSLSSRAHSVYRELQFTGRYQLRQGSQLYATYIRSTYGGGLNNFDMSYGNFQDPIVRRNQRAFQPYDVPNRFLTWAAINLPYEVVVLPELDVRDGFPYSLLNAYQDFVGPRNRAGRFPRFASFDLEITKGLRLPFRGKQYRARVGLKVYNLTDHFNPRDLQNNVDSVPVLYREECSRFGEFCNSVGRVFRGKLSLDF